MKTGNYPSQRPVNNLMEAADDLKIGGGDKSGRLSLDDRGASQSSMRKSGLGVPASTSARQNMSKVNITLKHKINRQTIPTQIVQG